MSVSVLIATHNRSSKLRRALRSLTNQTFVDFEVIIVDDRSIDDTLDVIDSYVDDLDITTISKKHDSAPADAIDLAYRNCSADWVVRLDDDDEFTARCLDDLYKNKDGFDIIFGNYVEIYKGNAEAISPDNIMHSIACGVLMNKKSLDSIGGLVSFDVGVFIEYDLYIRAMIGNKRIKKINSVVYNYHRSDQSMTRDNSIVQNSLDKIRGKWGSEYCNLIRKY